MIRNNLLTDFPISRMMDDFLSANLVEGLDHVPVSRPKTNIVEHEDAYELEMTVPGMTKENIQLEVEDETLTVEGMVQDNKEEEVQPKFFRREFQVGAFKRSFKLPKTLDVEKIEANYKDGILYIRLPKTEKVATRKLIDIA